MLQMISVFELSFGINQNITELHSASLSADEQMLLQASLIITTHRGKQQQMEQIWLKRKKDDRPAVKLVETQIYWCLCEPKCQHGCTLD